MSTLVNEIKNAFHKQHNALMQLILINIFVFLCLILVKSILSFFPNDAVIEHFISKNIELSAPALQFIQSPWTLLNYSFIHYGFWHLVSNMLTLYWFGRLLQAYIGSRKLMILYLLGGIFSGIFYLFFYNFFAILHIHNMGNSLVGASGAIFAIIFAVTTLLPQYEFNLFGLIQIRVKLLAWFLLFLSFVSLSSALAHVGGAFFGFLYIKLLQNGIDLGSPIETLSDWWISIRNPKNKVRPFRKPVSQTVVSLGRSSEASANTIANHFPDQDEVDALLDKISNSGYESLSKDEKQQLYRASQKE